MDDAGLLAAWYCPNAVNNCHVNPHLPFVKYFKGELVHFVDKNVTSGTKYLQ